MFGKNAIARIAFIEEGEPATGDTLEVNAIFSTIQGEGPFAGEPAIFIRLTGCNLRCHFCDTEFEKGETMTIEQIVERVVTLTAHERANDLVVLTGGEPMRQQIIPLLCELSDHGYKTQIETAGTVWPPAIKGGSVIREATALEDLIEPNGDVTLVCSPKTPKLRNEIIDLCNHFKYIIRDGEIDPVDGLPNASTQIKGTVAQVCRIWRPDRDNCIPTIWLQPCTEYHQPVLQEFPVVDAERTATNAKLAAGLCMLHGYRLSLQLHKIVGLD